MSRGRRVAARVLVRASARVVPSARVMGGGVAWVLVRATSRRPARVVAPARVMGGRMRVSTPSVRSTCAASPS